MPRFIKHQLGNPNWQSLREQLAGELFTDLPTRKVYATDASIYEQLPIGEQKGVSDGLKLGQ